MLRKREESTFKEFFIDLEKWSDLKFEQILYEAIIEFFNPTNSTKIGFVNIHFIDGKKRVLIGLRERSSVESMIMTYINDNSWPIFESIIFELEDNKKEIFALRVREAVLKIKSSQEHKGE